MATAAQIDSKSFVIPGEDEAELSELAASYRTQFQPAGPEESLLLDKIVAADWTQRRLRRVEAEVFNTLIAQLGEGVENPLGAAFLKDCQGPKALQQIFRCREAASREWYQAIRQLRELQSLRLASETPPASEFRPSVPSVPEPAMRSASFTPEIRTAKKIGFVFDGSTPPAWRL